MNHTITLTAEEEAFLKSILETKFKTNGVVPTIDEVLTNYAKKKIANLEREQDRYIYPEKLKSKWNSLPDSIKTQVKTMLNEPEVKTKEL